MRVPAQDQQTCSTLNRRPIHCMKAQNIGGVRSLQLLRCQYLYICTGKVK